MLKMKDLVELTNESKSTILYYLKEGLLPEPKKPKPNVHLYDERCVSVIKFIKYLQNLNYTINEIKELFKTAPLDKDSSLLTMIKALELATVSNGGKMLSKEEFVKKAKISEDELREFIKKEYILDRKDGFGTKELEIVQIVKKAKKLNIDKKLIDKYVKSAKEIAKIELETWSEIFNMSQYDNIDEYELLFDLILKLKPYIYNSHSIREYYLAKRG